MPKPSAATLEARTIAETNARIAAEFRSEKLALSPESLGQAFLNALEALSPEDRLRFNDVVDEARTANVLAIQHAVERKEAEAQQAASARAMLLEPLSVEAIFDKAHPNRLNVDELEFVATAVREAVNSPEQKQTTMDTAVPPIVLEDCLRAGVIDLLASGQFEKGISVTYTMMQNHRTLQALPTHADKTTGKVTLVGAPQWFLDPIGALGKVVLEMEARAKKTRGGGTEWRVEPPPVADAV
jgi:hypothetical protein